LKWLTFAETEREDLPTITKVVLAEIAARHLGGEAPVPVPFYYWKAGRFHHETIE
jgi:hypothetical protein